MKNEVLRVASRFGFVFMAACLSLPMANAQEVGAVAGEFSVTPDGQAAYTIPVQVPPGVLGVEPHLAVGHASGSGNGVVGLGGQLSGFSSITRCAANRAEDGFVAGVRHATTDRFCLDGRKLVAVNGAYGGDGTEYRTVPESFQKILSHGGVAYPDGSTGPSSFTVRLRHGGVLEFGLTDNARVRHPGSSVVHQWRVSRLVDVNGNALDYTYEDFGSGGAVEKHPVRIDYGANANAGQSHHLAVRLAYEIRSDTTTGYRNGIRFQQSRRVSAIVTEAGGEDVKVYALSYDTAPGAGESRLVSVTECAGDGTTCYAPTTFEWRTPASGWSTGEVLPPDALVDADGRRRGVAVDLDGDGRTDWLTAYRDGSGEHRAAWLSSGAGFTPALAYAPPDVLVDYTVSIDGAVLSELVDVNGDGLPDWVTAYRTAGGTRIDAITLNDGAGFNLNAPYDLPVELTDLTAGGNGLRKARLVDIDGDARVDVVVSTRDDTGAPQQGAWTNTGDGWSAAPALVPPIVALDYSTSADGVALAELVDLDDDGLPDWVQAVQTADGADHHAVWLHTGSGWQSRPGYTLPTVLITYVGEPDAIPRAELVDINGDGLLDVVQAHKPAGGAEVRQAWLNTGDAWQLDATLAPPVVLAERSAAGHDLSYGAFVDLDGDGRPDMARSYLTTTGSHVTAAWRQGDGGWIADDTLALPLPLHALRTGDDSVPVGGLVDMNHDGVPDLVRAATGYPAGTQLNSAGSGGIAEVHGVERITTGFGVETRIEYASSANSSVYVPAADPGFESYPDLPSPGPHVLVAAVEASDGIGGFNRSEHAYGESKVNLIGRGALGFASHTVTEPDTNTVLHAAYSQAYPQVGRLLHSTKTIDGTLISETQQTLASRSLHGGVTDHGFVSARTTTAYELNGAEISTVSGTTAVDDFGNVTQATTQTADVSGTYTETVTNTWQNDTANWVLGKLTHVTVQNTAPNVPSITRTTGQTINARGQTTEKVVEPGHAQSVTTIYAYDLFGNVTATTTSASGMTDRTGTVTYTGDGRFPATATNALGHVLSHEYDGRFGEVTRTEDPNGVVTTKAYDILGRQELEVRHHVDDDGQQANGVDGVLFTWCDTGTNCPANALYFISASDNEDESPETVYYDERARQVRKQTHGFDGAAIYQDSEYTARGRKARVSRPYFSGEAPEWTTFGYDALDRVIQVTAPNGAVTTTVHAGRTRTVTNALNQSASSTLNAAGKPVEEVDAAGGVTRHTYDALGRLVETEDPLGNLITASFDRFGRKTAMSDPDMGSWTYQYDAFGQLVSQTDAKGQTVTMSYDALGRMTQRVEPEGTTTWTFDTAPNGIGKLAQVNQPGYSRSHTYDDRGRPLRETVIIDGEPFDTETAYEGTTDRVDYVVYPNGWTLQKAYNDFGFPLDVRSVKATDAAAVAAQEQVRDDLIAAAQTLEDDLADTRQDHYDQMVHFTGLADPLAAQAKSLANEANRKIEAYNDAARTSRKYANSYSAHRRSAKEIQRQIEWREGVRENHIAAADAAADQGSQYGYDRHVGIANQYATEINDLIDQYNQKMHVAEGQAYAANQWAETANTHAAQAQSLQTQAQNAVNQANAHYATANTHVDAINDIDRQIEAAVDAANDAHAQLEALQERLNDNAVTHWAAQGAAADGQITRFSQGNGIVTDLEFYADTGHVARIKAMGDPELGLPLTLEDIAEYLDKLDALVTDFNARILDFEGLAATAASEQALAESEADGERAIAQGHRDLGETALALLADARALQLDVEVAVQATRVQLNDGLVDIHQGTMAGALSLVSQYEGATGVPGQGRALQAAYHELLEAHYRDIESLYLGLAATYADLETDAADLEADPPLDEAGFLALADHSTELASFNETRAAAYDAAVITAVEGGVSTTPLSQQNLALSATLMEQRGHLFDHHGDAVDGVFRRGRDLAAVLSAYYDEQGQAGTAGHYQDHTTLGQGRVDFLRRMAGIYKDRGTVLLAELQAEQAAAVASGEDESLQNQFAELAGLYATQAATYTEMSTAEYWSDFYLGLANRLDDATGHYADQAAGNAILADQQEAEAAIARHANDHRLLVGLDGAVQDEQYYYDVLGNLTGRVDHAVDLDETYQYDALNRLTDSDLSGEGAALYAFAGVETTTYAYDAIGNLTHRSDAGSYTYGNGPASGAGVHAVTAISGLINTAFAYDANGNQVAGNGRSITWSSYNKPLTVSSGGDTVTMAYGPERQLIKQTRPDGQGGTRTTYYPGALYEKTVTSGDESRSRYHLTAAGKTVAVINETATGAPETHYLHRDHLDSIVATSNERGQLIERFHYDPFGQRRLAVVTDDPLGTTVDLARSDRGYTGHRHLEAVTLIHMNGRVYDPAIGRFLSADPHVQFAGHSQSYNRYSYLMNNPLNAVDPSGYFLGGLIKWGKRQFKKVVKVVKKITKKVVNFVKDNIKTIAAIAVVIAAPYAVAALAPAGSALLGAGLAGLGGTGLVVAGAVGGGLSGLITTGSLKGALIGAATGAAMAGIGNTFSHTNGLAGKLNWTKPSFTAFGDKTTILTTAGRAAKSVAHGLVGGISGKVSGASFSKSFVSTGFTQAAAPGIDRIGGAGLAGSSARIVAGGLVGGTAAVLAGGDFKNGLKNGVLSRGLNDEIHLELGARMSGWVNKAAKWVTGRDIVPQGGSLGISITAPTVNRDGTVRSGEWDVVGTLTVDLDGAGVGLANARALQVGWSTADSARSIAGYEIRIDVQYGSYGGSLSYGDDGSVGVDTSLRGFGLSADGAGSATSAYSFRHGRVFSWNSQ